MEKTFYIKNMVCDRCKSRIKQITLDHHAQIKSLQLGEITIETSSSFDLKKFAENLEKEGFEIIKDEDLQLTESIKVILLQLIDTHEIPKSLSEYLSNKLNRDYSSVSKIFRKNSGETLEKYFIRLKIEKVKELIQLQQLSFSEIAYRLNYNSISHLSGQFKNLTGMTMSEYQNSQNWNRKPLDKIL